MEKTETCIDDENDCTQEGDFSKAIGRLSQVSSDHGAQDESDAGRGIEPPQDSRLTTRVCDVCQVRLADTLTVLEYPCRDKTTCNEH